MVCRNCGQDLPMGAKFCGGCGTVCDAPVMGQPQMGQPSMNQSGMNQPNASQAASQAAQAASQAAQAAAQAASQTAAQAAQKAKEMLNSGDKKNIIFIAAGGAAAVIAVLIIAAALLGSSPAKVFKTNIKSAFNGNFDAMWNCSTDAKAAQKALDVYDADDYQDDYEDGKDTYKDRMADWKDDGIKYKVSVDVKKVTKINKRDKEFKWAQELLEDSYGYDADKAQAFAIVDAKVKAEYYEDGDRDNDYDINSKTEYLLVKLGGKWYTTDFSRDDIKKYLKDTYK